MNTQSNHGLNLEKEIQDQRDTDWIFGVSAPISGLAEGIKFKKYLPIGEVQRGKEDTMDCATRGPINLLEDKFTYLYQVGIFKGYIRNWLEAKGYVVDNKIVFSDAFIAIKSGTTQSGNSLLAPLEAIRKKGLIPKPVLPLEKWMTWADYHNPKRITKEMLDLGQEFLKLFTINYERVLNKNFNDIIDKDMISVAGFAWPSPINGEYPRTDNTFNHCFLYFEKPSYEIFDNYPDTYDGDFIKNLAGDYSLYNYGYRVIVNLKTQEITTEMVRHCWNAFLELQKAFPAPSFTTPGTIYTVYDWAQERGRFEHPEFFTPEYKGEEIVLQIEDTNIFFLYGPGGGNIDNPEVLKGKDYTVEKITLAEAHDLGIETKDAVPAEIKNNWFLKVVRFIINFFKPQCQKL
jgi:hypothetical protein